MRARTPEPPRPLPPLPEPTTAEARGLRATVTADRWERIVRDAMGRAEVLELVEDERRTTKHSWRACLEEAAPTVGWSAYLHWKRKCQARSGPGWERLLDERLPPPPVAIAEEIKTAACLLRRANRSLGPEAARAHLVAQFGEKGGVSAASLRRIWAAAGLSWERPGGEGQVPGEQVESFNGGAGLALLGAAEVELGTAAKLAAAVLAGAKREEEAQGEVSARIEPEDGRDKRGRFNSVYNAWWREGCKPGAADARWGSDSTKRRHRALSSLPTLSMDAEVLGARLLCMGVMPLVTERRGFVGLEGPAGAWLALLAVRAYMPRTLDKELTELGLLGVGEAMWEAHARQWHEQSRRWSEGGPPWLRWAVYVDSTQDPYWTRHFALSGKVSRVGRVMPCLNRVAVASGAGVPVVVETHAGTVSLKKRLIPLLERLDEWLGEGEVGRLTIIDAEMATGRLLWTLDRDLDRGFITVLKGAALRGAEQRDHGPWQPFREHDQVRELTVVLHGEGVPKSGFELRGVEMERGGSRRPRPTLFVSNWDEGQLPPVDVAAAYLSRWPHQEQGFRNSRNGGGMERSHGFGGELVTNVALQTKVEKASNRLDRAKDHLADVEEVRDELVATLPVQSLGKRERKRMAKTAEAEVRKSERAVERAQRDLVEQCTMPREVYARDPGRDGIMTCLKLNCLLLLEYALKEYFGGLRMEWRTFIEQYLWLAVTVRSRQSQIVYQIHGNARQPERMAQLRAACDVINRRRLHRDKQVLRYEVIDAAAAGS